MQEGVVNPNSVMGPSGPYGALANYYIEAERRKAAKQGNLPGTDQFGSLNQGAVDQIMSSLATHVAPLYGSTLQSYATAYTAEQNALDNLLSNNINAFGQEQSAIDNSLRTTMAGIDPYQGSSNAAIGAIGNMVGERVDAGTTAVAGGTDALDELLAGIIK
jgi:hypothetical protein